jgi:hypothetical protein
MQAIASTGVFKAMNPVQFDKLQFRTRRQFLGQAGQFSLGALALQAMQQEAGALPAANNPLAPQHAPMAAKARRVIYLHMSGAPRTWTSSTTSRSL